MRLATILGEATFGQSWKSGRTVLRRRSYCGLEEAAPTQAARIATRSSRRSSSLLRGPKPTTSEPPSPYVAGQRWKGISSARYERRSSCSGQLEASKVDPQVRGSYWEAVGVCEFPQFIASVVVSRARRSKLVLGIYPREACSPMMDTPSFLVAFSPS
jgi:hypothetical protein